MSKIYELENLEASDREFTVPNGVRELSYDVTTGKTPDEYSKAENIRNGWFCE